MPTRYCACGCGGEVKTWSNGVSSPFLRGHHMRKPNGFTLPNLGKIYCKCGCGSEIKVWKNGYAPTYVKGHHLKGTKLSLDYRLERTRNRWGVEPILSPYLNEVIIKYNRKMKRWSACVKTDGKISRNVLHAKAVYKHHFGEIPEGYVVHHKDGNHSKISDDRPENLMLLPDEWNLRFFPVLAKGFGVSEEVVSDLYLTLDYVSLDKNVLFSELCSKLIEHTKKV